MLSRLRYNWDLLPFCSLIYVRDNRQTILTRLRMFYLLWLSSPNSLEAGIPMNLVVADLTTEARKIYRHLFPRPPQTIGNKQHKALGVLGCKHLRVLANLFELRILGPGTQR